jgi:hypothetical protein
MTASTLAVAIERADEEGVLIAGRPVQAPRVHSDLGGEAQQ